VKRGELTAVEAAQELENLTRQQQQLSAKQDGDTSGTNHE
jgi:hypothetical protein